MSPGRRRSATDPRVLCSRHLLLLRSSVTVDDVDSLVRCWYPDSDLAGSRSTDLAGQARLNGPHQLDRHVL